MEHAERRFLIRELPGFFRLGITVLIVTILGGYVVSGVFLKWDHENRDEQPGLSYVDIAGAYAGATIRAPMLEAMDRHHPEDLPEADRKVLLDWLSGGRIAEDFDNLDKYDFTPSEIIAASCVKCHARSATERGDIGKTMPLEFWDDVRKVSFSREIKPRDIKLVAASTHAHAPAMSLILLTVGLLAAFARAPRFLSGAIFALAAAGLLADMGGQWLARREAAWVWAVILGGFVYTFGASLLGMLVVVDLWWPRGKK